MRWQSLASALACVAALPLGIVSVATTNWLTASLSAAFAFGEADPSGEFLPSIRSSPGTSDGTPAVSSLPGGSDGSASSWDALAQQLAVAQGTINVGLWKACLSGATSAGSLGPITAGDCAPITRENLRLLFNALSVASQLPSLPALPISLPPGVSIPPIPGRALRVDREAAIGRPHNSPWLVVSGSALQKKTLAVEFSTEAGASTHDRLTRRTGTSGTRMLADAPAGASVSNALNNLKVLQPPSGGTIQQNSDADTAYDALVAVRVLMIIAICLVGVVLLLNLCVALLLPTRAALALPIVLACIALACGIVAISLEGAAQSAFKKSTPLPWKLGSSWVLALIFTILLGVSVMVQLLACCMPNRAFIGGPSAAPGTKRSVASGGPGVVDVNVNDATTSSAAAAAVGAASGSDVASTGAPKLII